MMNSEAHKRVIKLQNTDLISDIEQQDFNDLKEIEKPKPCPACLARKKANKFKLLPALKGLFFNLPLITKLGFWALKCRRFTYEENYKRIKNTELAFIALKEKKFLQVLKMVSK